MVIEEALRASTREIRANKFRSALSFAAISVGVASLLYTVAQIGGMHEAFDKQIALQGPGRMSIEKKRNYESKGLSPGLTYEDALAIRAELPALHMVDPRDTKWGARLTHGKTKLEVRLAAATPEWRKRDWVYSLRGRFINEWDLRHAARVCVVVEPGVWLKKPFWAKFWGGDEEPYEAYMKRRDMLGRVIALEDKSFTVVGVLKPPFKDLDPRWDSWDTPQVLIPITSYLQTMPDPQNPRSINEIVIDTGSEKTIAPMRRAIELLIKRRHRGEEDFEIQDLREQIANRLQNMRAYVIAGVTLGVVALIAGGVGIMNVTLATIFSRVKEIGIRRAVGADRGDIILQFVLEAALLGAAGGAMGIALGVGGLQYLRKNGEQEIARITALHCVEAVLLGALVSALFAAMPAFRASKLDPVEALRSE